ncbi:hypothetical protein [Brevundimonas sp.]|uniref:hypothetical protein n=1 Tax=Brevundimonas sp. TaxID=1871086 RepID=UPI0028A2845C|nr:hypothetical protein [Brevundimonas sp.]
MIALVLATVLQSQTVTLQCDGVSNDGDGQRVARANVEITGQSVRVKAPSELFATFTGRRQDFWRDLSDVVVTDREIRGRNSPSMVSRMEVVIDRMTGAIRINVNDVLAGGTSSFMGDCTVVADKPLF